MRVITLDELQEQVAESESGLLLMTAEQLYYHQECEAEQRAEQAYELAMDYRAWLLDGGQPAHAF